MKPIRFIQWPLLMLAFVLLMSCQKDEGGAKDPAVTALLHRYFETWSAKEMDAYTRCFDDGARIYYIANDGKMVAQAKIDFVHEQKVLQEESSTPMKEVPVDIRLQGDEKVQQAAVTWVLTKGDKEVKGTDFFTLRRVGGEWKIVSLAFYGE
jgi:hypothetical protein